MAKAAGTDLERSQVHIKLAYLNKPYVAKLSEMTDAGVWIDSREVIKAIEKSAGMGHRTNVDTARRKTLFIPFAQVQWILAVDVLK